MLKSHRDIFLRAVLIGAALLCVRLISSDFAPGTKTTEQPYLLFMGTLVFAGMVWFSFLPLIKKMPAEAITGRLILIIFTVGLAARALFFGSTPIYEDDWNRYLWDGYVAANHENPYIYSPENIRLAGRESSAADAQDIPDSLKKLVELSTQNGDFVQRINSPQYTTIYPPIAVAVFTLSAYIGPLNLDVLRIFFWLSEALTLFLMMKALTAYGRSPLWMTLYALNPLIIYAAMNAAHMDVLLLPALLGVMLLIKTRPFISAALLALAAAIKIWPLLLAPIYYRHWLKQPLVYVGAAALTGILSLILLWPLLSALGEASGTSAYAATWQRSTYLYPLIDEFIGKLTGYWSTPARLLIAAICIGLSLWLGFRPVIHQWRREKLIDNMPLHLLLVTFVFYLLSPTGFPWYVIWLFAFIPFAPRDSVAMLTVLLPIYYVRYALGEQNIYSVYTDWLVPLQFSIPLGLFLLELSRGEWRADYRYAPPAFAKAPPESHSHAL